MNSKYDDGSTFIIGHGSNPLFLVQKSVQTSLICRSISMSGFFLCKGMKVWHNVQGDLGKVLGNSSVRVFQHYLILASVRYDHQTHNMSWLLYFSNMILNTLHHVICCHLSTRYCAYLKMMANFKSHGTMYSKLGY